MKRPELPSAYPHHKHASEQAREIAQDGLILLAEVGSTAHGTNMAEADDQDLMGITLEPPEYVIGLSRVPASYHFDSGDTVIRHVPFEQFERHTAWDRSGGLSERSGPGDVDVLVYSARKWARLALDGNPTVLVPLFSPLIKYTSPAGEQLRRNAYRFASKQSLQRFLGYLHAQKQCMTGERSKRTNRPELVDEFGYDTKFAAHAVRLGLQGVEWGLHQTITLPIPQPELDLVLQVRRGEMKLEWVLETIDALQKSLESVLKNAPLPEHGDRDWLNQWLIRSCHWRWRDLEMVRYPALLTCVADGTLAEIAMEDMR